MSKKNTMRMLQASSLLALEVSTSAAHSAAERAALAGFGFVKDIVAGLDCAMKASSSSQPPTPTKRRGSVGSSSSTSSSTGGNNLGKE